MGSRIISDLSRALDLRFSAKSQHHRFMNGRDFLSVAKDLLTSPTEAAWRTSVSRAYYAAFYVARQLLEDLGFAVPRGERAHAYLWLRLSNCGEPRVQDAGRRLNTVRGQRNRADYDVTFLL